MADLTCDVAIVGAGTAGLAAERIARKSNAKTLLIDPHFSGTTCASVGCMPSKLLIAAANAAYDARMARDFGVHTSMSVDGAAVMARVRRERDRFVAATLKSIDELPTGVCIRQKAHFAGPTTLMLEDGWRIATKAVVIATGSKPGMPEPFKALGDIALTNETIFELVSLPRSMAVIGAGPLGLELAQAMTRLGVETAVFDQGDRIAGLHDPEVATEVLSLLGREFPIHLGIKLHVDKDRHGARLSWSGSSTGAATFERILVAAGRPPALHDLKVEAAGLKTDEHGVPEFEPTTMQCGTAPIFLAGDVGAQRPVLHEASTEGAIAGRNAALFPDVNEFSRSVPLSIMFTTPPLAMVGAGKTTAMIVGSAGYADQGRARIEARNVGLVRLYADATTGVLKGATMFASGMDHIAHLVAWAVEREETAAALLQLPIYHPTLEEGLRPALREICKATNTFESAGLNDAGAEEAE